MADVAGPVRVECVFAEPDAAWTRTLELPAGSTAAQAVSLLEAATDCPREVIEAVHAGRFGVFGRRVGSDAVLGDGDRLEIYRPLTADPKDARRRRAARSR
ncbi:MAG TPA: RnfH family protein [Dyella sp.]|nr:RnfH family protein [Dyella sp.]